MTQENRQLLLKDLCARLPYGVMVQFSLPNYNTNCFDNKIGEVFEIGTVFTHVHCDGIDYLPNTNRIKPYLRPMSSMTEEEQEEFRTLILPEASCAYEDCLEWDAQIISGGYLQISVEDFSKVTDWLIAHHFDYHRLIEKGLALEAPEGMYKID